MASFFLGILALLAFGGTFLTDLVKSIFGLFGTGTVGMLVLAVVLSTMFGPTP